MLTFFDISDQGQCWFVCGSATFTDGSDNRVGRDSTDGSSIGGRNSRGGRKDGSMLFLNIMSRGRMSLLLFLGIKYLIEKYHS